MISSVTNLSLPFLGFFLAHIINYSHFNETGESVKQLITIGACVLAASGMTNRCAAGTDDALTVKTKMGKVHGKAINAGNGHASSALRVP